MTGRPLTPSSAPSKANAASVLEGHHGRAPQTVTHTARYGSASSQSPARSPAPSQSAAVCAEPLPRLPPWPEQRLAVTPALGSAGARGHLRSGCECGRAWRCLGISPPPPKTINLPQFEPRRAPPLLKLQPWTTENNWTSSGDFLQKCE